MSQQINHPKVAAIGEVLWDVFESGPRFGGAPANFACTFSAIAPQADVLMISAIGNDPLGQAAIRELHQRQVDTSLVQRTEQLTGKVDICLDNEGVASYEFLENCAWDNLRWTKPLVDNAPLLDAVCFGSLGQRSELSRETIQQFIAATSAKSLRIFDVNLRAPFFDRESIERSLELANVLKLNDEELPILADWYDLSGSEIDKLHQIAECCNLICVALTRGANGAAVVLEQEVSEHDGVKATVVDTVGAGDAFTAALTQGLLAGADISEIVRAACELAAFVCSQPGATPGIPTRFALR